MDATIDAPTTPLAGRKMASRVARGCQTAAERVASSAPPPLSAELKRPRERGPEKPCPFSFLGLVVSQFTLHASTKKGNRPSFLRAAHPQKAEPFYEQFCTQLATVATVSVQRGVFGADMQVALSNDGPVTICIDSRERE